MPVTPTYPGVYIEELPSGVRTITGVATSITAFIGRALWGPVNEPVRIQSFADFERQFGGLWEPSTMSYAVQQFFLNGGGDALVVRLVNTATVAEIELPTGGGDPLVLLAANEGTWGNGLRAFTDYNTATTGSTSEFNLTVEYVEAGRVKSSEVFRNLEMAANSRRYAGDVLRLESGLVRLQIDGDTPTSRPNATALDAQSRPIPVTVTTAGSDGSTLSDALYQGIESQKTGIYALEKADLFNLLCLPPITRDTDINSAVWSNALAYCFRRRAMLIVDSPRTWGTHAAAIGGLDAFTNGFGSPQNAALFFPRVRLADPLKENRLADFAACGAVAGIMARTDVQRGVWKAPAGIDASLSGVRELTVKLTDGENGQLNPLGVNCLRSFPVYGNVVWGARTLAGADRRASEWKYIPVRRLALFLEESLYRGTQWVVFEPNDEPLWAQIRLNLGAFMQGLFRQGAFQGSTPREAYFVKCDRETTTQNDINLGIVNIVVGFAPLKPAEFVIIKFQQIAGSVDV